MYAHDLSEAQPRPLVALLIIGNGIMRLVETHTLSSELLRP